MSNINEKNIVEITISIIESDNIDDEIKDRYTRQLQKEIIEESDGVKSVFLGKPIITSTGTKAFDPSAIGEIVLQFFRDTLSDNFPILISLIIGWISRIIEGKPIKEIAIKYKDETILTITYPKDVEIKDMEEVIKKLLENN